MNTVKVENCKTLFIGRRGENEVTEVVFDFTAWQEQFGTGVINLYVKRSVDFDAYPVVLSIDGTVATWLVTAADTDVVGSGKIEFVYTVDQKVAKSAIFPFYVGEDIGQASSEPPDPYESWIETLTELGTETQANAQAAAQSASDAADSAASASESAGQAEDSAEDAEAWAVGERNGEPVSASDETYENNAKYWAENARANAPVQSVNGKDGNVELTLDDIPNGETFARATPEQLAQIGKNADDIADIDAMIPSITSESNHLVNVSFLTNRLTSYRTSAAQDAIDAGKQEKITAYGILKRDRSGNITAAIAGADYVTADALNSYRKATAQDAIDNAQNENINKNTAALNTMQPAATAADIGKALIVKTVADGKPTSYEYGEAGGGGSTLTAGDGIAITEDVISNTQGIEYIVGTQTAATSKWTGVSTDETLKVGKIIAYYLPFAGTSTVATLALTMADGTTTREISLQYKPNSSVTTQFPAGSIIILVYDGTYWRVNASYDTDTNTNPTGYCLTNGSVAAKAAACSFGYRGDTNYFPCLFRFANTATDATLAITTYAPEAAPIYVNGARTSTTNTFSAGVILFLYYNGAYYCYNDGRFPILVDGTVTSVQEYAAGLLADYRTAADQDLIDNGKQAKITATGILKGDGAGGVSSAVAGVDYLQSAPVTSVNGQTGDVTVQVATDAQVTTAVNTWLGENVAQETGYVLDASLTMSNAAPPASAVGELKSALNTVEKYTNETIPLYWEQGSINSNTGSDITSTSKIRTQRIDLTNYSHVTFNNTTGYKFRTAWLASDGSVVKDVAYSAYRTVTSVSYGYMERYGISAVRIVLSKSDDTSDITPASGSVFSVVGVPKIKTQITAIDQIIHKGYDNKSTEWDEYPLSVEDFSVGSLNVSTGAVATGYRPITGFITFDNDMMISIETTYKVDVFVYQQDGTFVKHTGFDYTHYIPYADDRKYKFTFDLANAPNNSTSPQIDTLLHSNVFIGVKKKKQYIRDSVDDVVDNMEGQNGNCLNIAFITDLHVTAFEAISLKTINVWGRTTNGLAKVDKLRNIDFVVLGGDYLWNNASHTSLKMAEDAYDLLQEVFYQFKDKEFALKGNHDDNSITNDVSKLITDSMRYGYLGQQYTNQVEVKYGDIEKSYGYIDFKRQKVRAIFINTVDIPYDDNLTYKGQHITGVGNDQLNFIANALNFNEAGWSVIFFSHHLLINNATMNPSSDAETYLLSTHGGDALWGIILAYKGKTTYSKVSTLTDFNYSVSVDYTSNHSDSVLACICGHTHRDLSATQDGILMISTTASGYGQTAYDSTGTKITYTEGTQTETAFDIFSFDRVNGTIKASRYGAGQNRTWS